MNKKGIIGSIAVGIFLVGAVAVGATNNDSSEKVAVKNTNTEILSVDEVKEIALNKYNGQIEEIELENIYYEVEIDSVNDNDIELIIDAYTGEILTEDHDDDDRDKNSQIVTKEEQTNTSVLSAEEATKIAEETTGAKVVEIELDEDDGRLHYEIELYSSDTEIEMEIDAKTGEILEMEYDD